MHGARSIARVIARNADVANTVFPAFGLRPETPEITLGKSVELLMVASQETTKSNYHAIV